MLYNERLLNQNTMIMSRLNEETYEKYFERVVIYNRNFFMETGTLKFRHDRFPDIGIKI
jgi:hypothetical protein